jgi:hypothetical protein
MSQQIAGPIGQTGETVVKSMPHGPLGVNPLVVLSPVPESKPVATHDLAYHRQRTENHPPLQLIVVSLSISLRRGNVTISQ